MMTIKKVYGALMPLIQFAMGMNGSLRSFQSVGYYVAYDVPAVRVAPAAGAGLLRHPKVSASR